jgi:hypothetical protein
MIVVILEFLSKLWSLQSLSYRRSINIFDSKCFNQPLFRSNQLLRTLLNYISVYLLLFNSNEWLVYRFKRLRTFGVLLFLYKRRPFRKSVYLFGCRLTFLLNFPECKHLICVLLFMHGDFLDSFKQVITAKRRYRLSWTLVCGYSLCLFGKRVPSAMKEKRNLMGLWWSYHGRIMGWKTLKQQGGCSCHICWLIHNLI